VAAKKQKTLGRRDVARAPPTQCEDCRCDDYLLGEGAFTVSTLRVAGLLIS
jgi:hypothetical protein